MIWFSVKDTLQLRITQYNNSTADIDQSKTIDHIHPVTSNLGMLQTNHDGTKILGDEKSISDQISTHSDYANMGKKIMQNKQSQSRTTWFCSYK